MPSTIVVDSGLCVALFDAGDEYHERAIGFLRETSARMVSTLAVVTEVMFLFNTNLPAQKDFLAWVHRGAMTLVEPQAEDFQRVIWLMEKYADLPMDFTDALLVALCERLGVKEIATVDDDFTIYRWKGRGRFRNVFLNSKK